MDDFLAAFGIEVKASAENRPYPGSTSPNLSLIVLYCVCSGRTSVKKIPDDSHPEKALFLI
jgi:hypothetical protein